MNIICRRLSDCIWSIVLCMKSKTAPPQMRLGQEIKKRRKELGYSQEGFAHICDIHRTYMSLIERGKSNLSLEILVKIAEKLKLSVSELCNRAKL